MTYRIANWNEHYENDRSRTRDKCGFVCVPNQDSMAETLLLADEDGLMIYGLFIILVRECSKQPRPREGYLTHNGASDGEPWTAEDMALRSRSTIEKVGKALRVLCSQRVRLIEVIDVGRNDGDSAGSGRGAGHLEGKKEGKKEDATHTRRTPDPVVEVKQGARPPHRSASAIAHEGGSADRRPPAATGEHAALVKAFCDGWEARYGDAYPFKGGRDGAHIKAILGHAKSLERATQVVGRYLASNDAFDVKNRHGLGLLVSQIQRFTVEPKLAKTAPTKTRVDG